jgi:TetR/AcrR family transcriptional regulator, lmrAB and yxaGH operons repressor
LRPTWQLTRHATAFSDVVQESGAPRGSIYFHFPGGKQELARETIARAADEIEEMVHQAASHADDPASLIRALVQIQMERLEASSYCSGCAIATMVIELAPQERGTQRRVRPGVCPVAHRACRPPPTMGR